MFKISKSPIHAHDKNTLYRLFLLNRIIIKNQVNRTCILENSVFVARALNFHLGHWLRFISLFKVLEIQIRRNPQTILRRQAHGRCIDFCVLNDFCTTINSYRIKIIRNIRETQEINSLCFFQKFLILYFSSIFRIKTFFRFQAKRARRCGLAFEARSGDSPGTSPGQALDPVRVGPGLERGGFFLLPSKIFISCTQRKNRM